METQTVLLITVNILLAIVLIIDIYLIRSGKSEKSDKVDMSGYVGILSFNSLAERVWILENPPKLKNGDNVNIRGSYMSGKIVNRPMFGFEANVIGYPTTYIKRYWKYDVLNEENNSIHTFEESSLFIKEKEVANDVR